MVVFLIFIAAIILLCLFGDDNNHFPPGDPGWDYRNERMNYSVKY